MSKKCLNDVYTLPSINVQTSLSKVCHLTEGTSMVSIHPPSHQPIKLFVKEKTLHAFPDKSAQEGMDTDNVQFNDLKKGHEQANYTNAILNTITEQLNQLSTKTDSKKEAAKKEMESPRTKPSSSSTESVSKPFVKLDSIPKANIESLSKAKISNLNILCTISEQIKVLEKKRKLSLVLTKLSNKRMTASLPQWKKKKLLLVVLTKKRL